MFDSFLSFDAAKCQKKANYATFILVDCYLLNII
tara:strand:+ start:159 stop:260 length:102 start_codon:yes stop_codon:yes gene_type:complete